jgi:hypothetical protein
MTASYNLGKQPLCPACDPVPVVQQASALVKSDGAFSVVADNVVAVVVSCCIRR